MRDKEKLILYKKYLEVEKIKQAKKEIKKLNKELERVRLRK